MLANPLNSSDVYATSQVFKIVPQGSAYPTDSATLSSTGSASTITASRTGSATGSAAASPTNSASSGTKNVVGAGVGLFGLFSGLVGVLVA
jgi:hypothetical protein